MYRFGFLPLPCYHPSGLVSPARDQWRTATRYRAATERIVKSWALPGQEETLEALLADATWRERCWDKLDDLANASLPLPCRTAAAERLQTMLGPVDYFAGRMPDPWPAWSEP